MIVCVVGPTGVGKTKMSIALAKKYNAIVINCDAMQVYKGMDIATAKIKEEEKEGIKHYLFDICEIEDNYTIYDYQKDCRKIIDENQNKNIIFVGGSGLYLKAALFDYQFFKEENTNTYENLTNEELYALCLKKDKNMQIHKNNRKRLIRFLNKENIENVEPKLLYEDVYFIGLTTDRKKLYDKINKRVETMVEEGLLKEAKKFYDLHITCKSLNTVIGYKELFLYFDQQISYDEAISLIQKNSRHYAKRQYTWFNHQIPTHWFLVDYNYFDNTINEVIQYIEEKSQCL